LSRAALFFATLIVIYCPYGLFFIFEKKAHLAANVAHAYIKEALNGIMVEVRCVQQTKQLSIVTRERQRIDSGASETLDA
jgi:hypothetical protein